MMFAIFYFFIFQVFYNKSYFYFIFTLVKFHLPVHRPFILASMWLKYNLFLLEFYFFFTSLPNKILHYKIQNWNSNIKFPSLLIILRQEKQNLYHVNLDILFYALEDVKNDLRCQFWTCHGYLLIKLYLFLFPLSPVYLHFFLSVSLKETSPCYVSVVIFSGA